MTFQKGVKFRIYPNREQRNLIDRTLGCSRLIYNKGLAMREDAFKSGVSIQSAQYSFMCPPYSKSASRTFKFNWHLAIKHLARYFLLIL